ncbi:PREDICTED: zinc finger protein CONSTANS-LIKE 5-like [Nelumbo nucifera]|uniref:CCT domain-containing protein n=2 Tax=Nelumbo nucifera TaxID=4432 RepID=A0A822Y8J7_NELNU|nr:PREDICTED: zinc finger protein CONSTANS-LIKE 5-like [Nelumbo nucifera]DAD25928.1 TPA_asm: hypothetical protein HUJ06_027396 [Nelumbo nucifera]
MMTTSLSSSEPCYAYHIGSGTAFCSLDSTCLHFSSLPQQVSNGITVTPSKWLSPAEDSPRPSHLHEFQFLETHNVAAPCRFLESREYATPVMQPVTTEYQQNPSTTQHLILDACRSSTSSSVSPSGSSPSVEVSVVGQAASSPTSILLFTGSMPTDNTRDNFNEILSNSAVLGQEDDAAAERKAKVMRYREKKKKRKFDKQIRYATRKIHAEARPRIRGRFAKSLEPNPDEC